MTSGAITTIISARDEELHIERCVRSALPLGRVVVVDSGSLDRTMEVARAAGAEVIEHAWEGYAAQKNWALDNVGVDTPWVLLLDADEHLTEAGRKEIRDSVARSAGEGFLQPRAYVFLGRQLRHAWWYPDYQLRLFRHGAGRFEERLVHEHVLLDGRILPLKEPLLHENLKGIDAFVQRHLRYAGLEAIEMRREMDGVAADGVRGRFFGTPLERRRALKTRVWYRLSCRPAVRFAWLYFVRRGFLDGRHGRVFCQLMAAQEALIDAKLLELEHEDGRR